MVRPGPASAEERAARARGVDEDDALPIESWPSSFGVVGDRQIRARQVERRLRAVEAAVAEEDDEHFVARPRPRREIGERLLDVLLRRPAADPRRSRSALSAR